MPGRDTTRDITDDAARERRSSGWNSGGNGVWNSGGDRRSGGWNSQGDGRRSSGWNDDRYGDGYGGNGRSGGSSTYGFSQGKSRQTKKKPDRRHRTAKLLLILIALAAAGKLISAFLFPSSVTADYLKSVTVPDWIDVQLIEVDGAARRGKDLSGLSNIVIHYVGNPGTTAQQNRDYFNSDEARVSSHFVVGLQGEIIQCVPLNEISSASNDRNPDTISIEVCHPDASGQFTDESYQSLVRLTAWLCDIGRLKSGDVIRHYDITGKQCPLYYVEHEDAWTQLKKDVASAM